MGEVRGKDKAWTASCICHRDLLGIKLLACAPTASKASSYPLRLHTAGTVCFLTHLFSWIWGNISMPRGQTDNTRERGVPGV